MKKFTTRMLAMASLLGFAGNVSAEQVSVEGTLMVVSKDDFSRGQAQIVYLLETGTATYRIEFSGSAPDAVNTLANKKVRVSGDRSGNVIKVPGNASAVQAIK